MNDYVEDSAMSGVETGERGGGVNKEFALMNFQAITGEEDLGKAMEILEEYGWDETVSAKCH
jgi:hypothetical protein